MIQYTYQRATSHKDLSCKLIACGGKGKIIAGGTDLMVQLFEQKKDLLDLESIIDISGLESSLRYIKEDNDCIRIGSLVTHRDIVESSTITKHLPLLRDACNTVGSPQVRSRGTLGGSICNASPAADPLSPLIVAGATVIIESENGERTVDLEDFYQGRGVIDLSLGEFVKGFEVQKIPTHGSSSFIKVGRRKAQAISRLNVAVYVQLSKDGCIVDARIAPGAIYIKPHRVRKAEQLLLGAVPSLSLFLQAAELVGEDMIQETGVRWSTEYKLPALKAIVVDALCNVTGVEDCNE